MLRDLLGRSLQAAEYLIRAADTQDPAERQRLIKMAEDLLCELKQADDRQMGDRTA